MRLFSLLFSFFCCLAISVLAANADSTMDAWKVDPKIHEALWNKGEQLFQDGDYEGAKEAFKGTYPYKLHEQWYKIAHIESLQGHHAEAIERYKQALETATSPDLKAEYGKDSEFAPAENAVNLKNALLGTVPALLSIIGIVILFFAIRTKAILQLTAMGLFVSDYFLDRTLTFIGWETNQTAISDESTLSHFGISGITAFLAFQFWKKQRYPSAFLYGALALLFNPLFHLTLRDDTWQNIDAACFLLVGISIPFLNRFGKEKVVSKPKIDIEVDEVSIPESSVAERLIKLSR
jgi:tetratricopeptide (TPR) repeat protein